MFLFNRFLHSIIRFVLVSVMTIAMVLGWSAIAHSQLPSLPTAASNDPHKPPSGVTRLGMYEIASVYSPLDRNLLFEIVSPTVFNRSQPPDGSLPVEVRAEEITQRLMRALDRTNKAKQTPLVSIAILNQDLILQLSDDQTTRPLRLVTVTEPDADYHGKTLEVLAQEWQKILQAEVERINRLFSHKVLWQRIGQALQISISLVLGSVVLWLLRRTLIRKQTALQVRHQEQKAAVKQGVVKRAEAETSTTIHTIETSEKKTDADMIAHQRSQFLEMIQRQFSLKRQLGIYSLLTWLLFWTFILMWYIGIVVIMYRVPYLMRWLKDALARPLALLIIWFFISLVIRIGKTLIDRLTDVWTTHSSLPLSETQRIALRAVTVSGALKGLITFVFYYLGYLEVSKRI
ncbi:MAG: hypothetical protein V7K48_04090 [Nostoc sp.]|uniref:hypothetical protein n=1 Tax=Nostoc sp. TaxID=1180 RepID=UPI002FFA6A71